ncbi:FAD-dependent oxidoreductase [Aeoliella sp. SH292]|uniref:FAD-dependent oxidoreductase n=1 Tax=Aeoliella sp. SH292 TaxID=3454464 RepID=UPI003F97985E
MDTLVRVGLAFVLLALGVNACAAEVTPRRDADLVVYGASASGVMAAIQASRMGRTAIVLEPSQHIGGLTTGGLGATDAGMRYAVGGIAREFYRRVYDHYENPETWTRETREGYFPKHFLSVTPELKLQWYFEPHVASAILHQMLKEAGVQVVLGAALDRERGVAKDGTQIASITTIDGQRYTGRVFIDATYEGDLLAAAGASYVIGREGNGVHGETLNGVRLASPKTTQKISPFVIAGDPTSGLLPRLVRVDDAMEGEGDQQTQAYNFRLCLTNDPDNRVTIEKPKSYNPLNYEILLRNLQAAKEPTLNRSVFSLTPMPNLKTDTNNRRFYSTDYVGGSHRWPEGTYDERAKLWQEHKDYQQGLLWFVANDPLVPASVRNEAKNWGLARDEFTATDHWPPALYVREARRLVSDYVMTEHDCSGARVADDGLTLGTYAMDSHLVNYGIDSQNRFRVDGWFEKRPAAYPISYRATLPRANEVSNLLVSVCISSSHVAYGSIRMEPVFMNLGQATATAAVLALDRSESLHELPYKALRARLEADGQIFDAAAAKEQLIALRKKQK